MNYKQYYLNQAGSGYHNYPVYVGNRYQRGSGLGGVFKNFIRWIIPVVKTHGVPILKAAGTEAVKNVAHIATEAIAGKDVTTAVKERAHEVIDSVGKKPSSQAGNGYKKRKNSSKKASNKRRKFNDIFD